VPETKTMKRSAPKHFTREHQQYARSKVSSESCSINGAKGARATIERHGVDALFKRWQAWKLANPSRPEQLMIDILTRLKIKFEREKRIGDSLYSMDFYLTDTRQAIEVDSPVHTRLNAEKRKRQAATKRELLEQHRIPCLIIWDAELFRDDSSPVIRKIEDFIAQVSERGG
jgi:very-short-patch-repair endonuclease